MARKNEMNFGGPMSITFKNIQLAYNRSFKSAGIDITADQWRILNLLNMNDGVPQISLCEGSIRTAPTISRIIDLLCKKGITKRIQSKEDKRVYNIFLTAKGKKTINNALPIVNDLRKKGWNKLNQKDYKEFIRVLDMLNENFGKMH